MLVARRGRAAGRAADLHGLELLAVGNAAADVENDFTNGRAHRHFDEARVDHIARQGEGLRAGALLRADAMVPLHAVFDDERDVGKRLHVVEHRGFSPQAVLNGARGLDARHAAVALDGRSQGAALAADECARALGNMNAEVKIAAEDMLAEKPCLLRSGNGCFQTVHRQRIFRAHVNVALVAADGKTRDHHALKHAVGVALHHAAVHERAGVALVAVADDVFLCALLLARAVPFASGGETAAAAAAQAGIENVAADLLVRHLEQRLFKRAVTALGDVLLDVLGVRRAAVSQHHAVLLFIKRDLLLLRIRHAVQMINKAVDDLAAEDGLFQNFVAVLGLNVNVHHTQRLDVHQRAHLAKAVAAAHFDVQALLLVRVVLQPHIDLQPARFTLGLEIVVNLHCAAGNAAGARADENGRHLAALRKIMLRLRAQGAEFFSIQLVHACTPSFLRMESSSSIACSGSILACTSPSTVMTGANPQAPRHATVSSVKRPSSDVFFFPCSPRYS